MAAGKVVLSDGRVQNLEEETTVAEIMLENPQHVVVEFDPSSISFNDRGRKSHGGKMVKKKLSPLPADKTLEHGKIYLVLPAKRNGGSGTAKSSGEMTSEEIRKMLFSATAMVRSSFSYYEGILPWFTTRSTYNNISNNPAADAVVAAASVGRLEAETEEEGRPEFLSRQLSGRGWKPSLDPIKEKKAKKKIHQRLLF